MAIGMALLALEERWDHYGLISQTPYLGFLFFREGHFLPHPAAVVVLEFDRVDIVDGVNNLLGWKWLWPVDLNERVQAQRGKSVEPEAFTKSLVLLSYLLQVIFELFQLEYCPELVADFWIIGTVPKFYSKLASTSKLMDATGRVNNVAMSFLRVIHVAALRGQITAKDLQ